MKFGVAKVGITGTVVTDSADNVVKEFCSNKRKARDSKCWDHYKNLWADQAVEDSCVACRCPYGLVTTNALGGVSNPIALTSFWVRGIGDPLAPAEVVGAALVGENDLKGLSAVLTGIASGIRSDELAHFEAALHDTRHLNHSITQNSERLLTNAGWDPEATWDFGAIQKDDNARRALTIFAASRDLSQSILMHEISRHPEQAARDVVPTAIHKLFYRQIKISSERLESSGLNCSQGTTLRSLQLSSAFRVIPKIILDNAIKYSVRGSEIRLIFSEGPQFFNIECKNSGPTVKESEIQGLFKRGVRGSNKSGVNGQGIGLWLAKTIVEANGGLMNLEVRTSSVDYSGRRLGETIVTIKLPRSSIVT